MIALDSKILFLIGCVRAYLRLPTLFLSSIVFCILIFALKIRMCHNLKKNSSIFKAPGLSNSYFSYMI